VNSKNIFGGVCAFLFVLAQCFAVPCVSEPFFTETTPKLKSTTYRLPDFSELARALSPSVVNISVESETEEGVDSGPRGNLLQKHLSV